VTGDADKCGEKDKSRQIRGSDSKYALSNSKRSPSILPTLRWEFSAPAKTEPTPIHHVSKLNYDKKHQKNRGLPPYQVNWKTGGFTATQCCLSRCNHPRPSTAKRRRRP